MARKVIWTETAWRDLERSADYIAEDSPGYAAAFVLRVREHAQSLNELTLRSRVVPELRPPSTAFAPLRLVGGGFLKHFERDGKRQHVRRDLVLCAYWARCASIHLLSERIKAQTWDSPCAADQRSTHPG
jgi:plasmid stabilization system protein ParE